MSRPAKLHVALHPFYAWFNGQVEYTLPGDTFEPDGPLEVNRIGGSAVDPGARIWPFKRMVGKQAFDPELKTLLFNHVYGPETDTAFWTNFDWGKSIAAAMAYVGQPYSGKFDFVDTVMYWPIAHMVAPADQALGCEACHSRDGRLATIQGIYIPGTGLPPGGLAGLIILGLAALGAIGHGFLRLVARTDGQSGKGGDHG